MRTILASVAPLMFAADAPGGIAAQMANAPRSKDKQHSAKSDEQTTTAPTSPYANRFERIFAPVPVLDTKTGRIVKNAEYSDRFILGKVSKKQSEQRDFDNGSQKKLANLAIIMGGTESADLPTTGIQIVLAMPKNGKPRLEVRWPSQPANRFEKIFSLKGNDHLEEEMESYNLAIIENVFKPWRKRLVEEGKTTSTSAAHLTGGAELTPDEAAALGL